MEPIQQAEADACYFRAREIAKRVQGYIKEREVEFKQRERYNRYPRQLPPAEAIAAVLADEQLDSFTAELLIKELGRTGSAQLSLALLDQLIAARSPALSKPAFDAAIAVCSTQFMASEAVRVYGLLPQFGYSPDVHTCNMTVTACSQGGYVPGVMSILEDMRGRGIGLNDFTALMALQACRYKRRGRHEEAVQIVQQLLACGLRPSHEVSDALLSVCEASMDKAESLEAAQAAFEALTPLGLHACTRAYNAVLRACAARGDWRAAQAYFDEMLAANIPTNTQIFNSLIKACLAGGVLQNALAIFEWLVSGRHVGEDIQADISTYNILLKACHQAGHLEKALEIMAWLERSGVRFDSTTYEELIGVAEIAEIWDTKAIQEASSSALAVFPQHLRPAPYDAMRLTYLEHLSELAEEEALAYTKLGGVSWVSSSLTKGSQAAGIQNEGVSWVFMAPKEPRSNAHTWAAASPLVLSRMPSMAADVTLTKMAGLLPDGSSPHMAPAHSLVMPSSHSLLRTASSLRDPASGTPPTASSPQDSPQGKSLRALPSLNLKVDPSAPRATASPSDARPGGLDAAHTPSFLGRASPQQVRTQESKQEIAAL